MFNLGLYAFFNRRLSKNNNTRLIGYLIRYCIRMPVITSRHISHDPVGNLKIRIKLKRITSTSVAGNIVETFANPTSTGTIYLPIFFFDLTYKCCTNHIVFCRTRHRASASARRGRCNRRSCYKLARENTKSKRG